MNTIDKLYEDFTTHIAPKIADGLVITKDYFIDLFGRYIKYLIITDTVVIGFYVILLIIVKIILVKILKWFVKNKDTENEYEFTMFIGFIICVTVVIFSTLELFENTQNLIKAIYIPEVRIIEDIKGFNPQI